MAQARITIKCDCCGREFDHRKNCCNRAAAESYEEWARENITTCPDCWRQAKAEEEAEKVAEALKAAGVEMPELTGSPKQVAWAAGIRSKALKMFVDAGAKPAAFEKIAEKTESRWWIDNRDNLYSLRAIAKALMA